MSTTTLFSTIAEHACGYTDTTAINQGIQTAATTAITNSETGIIGKSIVVVGSILMGCFLGFSIVALTEPNRDVSKFIECSDDPRVAERKAIKKYQEKYCDELSRLDNKDISDEELKKLSKLQVNEETPFGNIIMSYNPNAESFWYYTDARNVPFKTLDAVARCFAVTYDCKQICVNYKEELAELRKQHALNTSNTECTDSSGNENTDEVSDESSDKPVAEKKSIFATFKNYKTDTKKQATHKCPLIIQNNNRFSCKGKLKDAPDILDESKEEPEPTNKTLTFSDFKNLLQNKKEQ